jgi:hypothetical protein
MKKKNVIKDNPKDPVTARILDLPSIEKQLAAIDCNVISLEQAWRHVHGKVSFKGKTLFLKMASTVGISRATRNESVWNRHLKRHLSPQAPFTVPAIVKTGTLSGKFYYLAEHIEEPTPLCPSISGANKKVYRSYTKALAESLIELSTLDRRSFIWDRRYKYLQHPGTRFFNRALSFFNSVQKPAELLPVLTIAKEISTLYRPALAHGDFTPWHMLRDRSNQLFLTDGEWGTGYLPSFYDLAYCYHRTCTFLGHIDVAVTLAAEYRSLLKKSQKNFFDKAFPAVVAERVLGGYWDDTQGKVELLPTLHRHKKLKEMLLKGRLY